MTELSRPKPPRNLMMIVAMGLIALFVALLFVIKGSDLGQADIDKAAAERKAAEEATRLNATVQNPEAATADAFAKAQREVKQEQARKSAAGIDDVPALPGGAPKTPSISDFELERLAKVEAELSQNRGRSTDQSVAGASSGGFVVYSASSGKPGSGNGGNGPSLGPAPKNVLVTEEEARRTGKGDIRAENERIRAQAQADANALLQGSGGGNRSGGRNSNEQWLFDAQSSKVSESRANIVAQTAKGLYWLQPGASINAVLLNAVDTRIPGRLTARVTQTIYDSRYGNYVVIPAGSTLVGQYRSAVEEGRNSVLMAFDTLVTPAGGMVSLGNMSASDALGRSGVPGKLNTNFWERLGIATLLAVESVALTRLSPETTTSTQAGTTTGNSTEAAQIITEVAKRELNKRYSVGPYITIEAGQPMTIITTGPIEVPPIANRK